MKNPNCVFCNIENDKIILKNDLSFVVNDKYPHSKGHVLIIPLNHVEDFFDLTEVEQKSMNELLKKAKLYTDNKYSPSAYNVNINVGKDAGQVVMHTHIHLIPRYK
jgi:diadenosine tetraphosphate (Ap4A) HIT family hydrolase